MTTNMSRVAVLRICIATGLGFAIMASAADGAQAMSRRECRQQWKAEKTTLKSEGKTKRTFLRACRTTAKKASPKETSTRTQ